ncbi:DUF3716 domain-containing protein [Aspergillus novofumigatus IBT 16806]|uniref:Uncharacterized protein n=1 Tax=Aspergillus novofumigatus (strain IBT 16806) TaxID=1392255 RepID=A0A2I1CI16_ASPN1|nr:uncharacterized protein P174DRAFT_363872 [Aspergillus novofumigatus IBT 16806]PKX97254.1 hypothetical protein P174DRAFT_363872 [Aspergillus novofumigatus IBT 16806]
MDPACKQCTGSGTFLKCIVSPEYDSNGTTRALFQGACANCLWHGKGSTCEFYLGRNKQWDSGDDMAILQAGGLLKLWNDGAVLQDMPPGESVDDSAERQSVASNRTPLKSATVPHSTRC